MKHNRQATIVIVAYLALLVVMGGRTALFVSKFDPLFQIDIFGGTISGLSVLLALALMAAVSSSSWLRAHFSRSPSKRRIATQTMIGAVIMDGAFNISEAIMLATETGTLSTYSGIVQYWLWFTVLLIGVGPTLLTVGLASLAGAVDHDARQTSTRKRTSVRAAVQIERSVEVNDVLEDHLTTISDQLSSGETFKRADVEQWTGLGKGQSINVINYGKERGLFNDHARGVYLYSVNGHAEVVENGQ